MIKTISSKTTKKSTIRWSVNIPNHFLVAPLFTFPPFFPIHFSRSLSQKDLARTLSSSICPSPILVPPIHPKNTSFHLKSHRDRFNCLTMIYVIFSLIQLFLSLVLCSFVYSIQMIILKCFISCFVITDEYAASLFLCLPRTWQPFFFDKQPNW